MDSILEIRRRAQEAQGPAAAGDLQEKDIGRDTRAIFRAAYNFYEKFHPPRLDAAYWGEAVKEINNLSIDFDNDPLLIGLLHAIYADLESGHIALAELEGTPQGAIDA